MEMEVVIPTMDFDFNSARSSPCLLSAPSTPKRFGDFYFSAPTTPTRLSQFYRDFDDLCAASSASAATPFDRKEKPSMPKSPNPNTRSSYEDDFAFDFSEELEKTAVPAEELFDGGKIRPFMPPPPQSISPISRIRGAFSLRKKKESDPPFAAAIRNTNTHKTTEHERGRERVPSLSSPSRRSRSLSPYRVSKYPWEEEEQQQQRQQLQQNTKQQSSSASSTTTTLCSSSSKGGYRKWRLKDFFLFRSASEGRASDTDPLRKYAASFKKHEEDVKKWSSFRAITEGSNLKRTGTVSAHELHYTVNRAVSEDLKRKTFLPYKQGILGRLAFNPAVHALANGFGFSRK